MSITKLLLPGVYSLLFILSLFIESPLFAYHSARCFKSHLDQTIKAYYPQEILRLVGGRKTNIYSSLLWEGQGSLYALFSLTSITMSVLLFPLLKNGKWDLERLNKYQQSQEHYATCLESPTRLEVVTGFETGSVEGQVHTPFTIAWCLLSLSSISFTVNLICRYFWCFQFGM